MAKTANDILFDRAVRHAVFLERYKNNEVDDIVGFLNREVFPDVTRQIQERTGGIAKATGKVRTRRLKSLEAAVKGEISTGMRLASSQLRKDLTGLAITEAEFQGAAVEAAMSPITVDFDIPNVATLREIAVDSPVQGRTIRQWFKKISDDSIGNIMGEVNIGLAEGQSVPEIVRRIRGTAAAAFGDGTYNQIRNWTRSIVRTSATHVSSRAREATYEANDDLIKGVQYIATLDARTTEICASLDGREFPINEGERPPQHHQCLPGDSLVLSRSRITGVSKRWYDGKMVIIEIATGRKISCTPNHPILTDLGWVAAGSLNMGDNVVCDGGGEWELIADICDKDIPASIHNIAESFIKKRTTVLEKVPITSEDFHGDVSNSKIAIIGSDCKLRDKVDIAVSKHFSKFDFVRRLPGSDRLFGLGNFHFLFKSFLCASSSIIGCFNKIFSFFRRSFIHPGLLLFASSANCNAGVLENSKNWPRGASKRFSNPTDTDSGVVHGDDFFLGQEDTSLVGGGSEFGSGATHSSSDSIVRDAELARNILDGSSGIIFLDKIINVQIVDFSGHVYNLQTDSGFYSANGIIVHNCRSTTVPVIKSFKELGIKAKEIPEGTRIARVEEKINGKVPARQTYPEWLRGQSKRTQNKMLGPTRAKLWRDGKVEMSGFVNDSGKRLNLDSLRLEEGLSIKDISRPT